MHMRKFSCEITSSHVRNFILINLRVESGLSMILAPSGRCSL